MLTFRKLIEMGQDTKARPCPACAEDPTVSPDDKKRLWNPARLRRHLEGRGSVDMTHRRTFHSQCSQAVRHLSREGIKISGTTNVPCRLAPDCDSNV